MWGKNCRLLPLNQRPPKLRTLPSTYISAAGSRPRQSKKSGTQLNLLDLLLGLNPGTGFPSSITRFKRVESCNSNHITPLLSIHDLRSEDHDESLPGDVADRSIEKLAYPTSTSRMHKYKHIHFPGGLAWRQTIRGRSIFIEILMIRTLSKLTFCLGITSKRNERPIKKLVNFRQQKRTTGNPPRFPR